MPLESMAKSRVRMRLKGSRKEKKMLRDNYRHALICTSTILMALVGALMLVSDPIVRANPDPDSAAANATFRTKCAMCHGQDGAGSAVGKSMNVPDLRSPVVQKLSDAELAQVISNGKGGMPRSRVRSAKIRFRTW